MYLALRGQEDCIIKHLEQLILPEREPHLYADLSALGGAKHSVSDRELSILAQAVGIGQFEANISFEMASGDMSKALLFELGRIRIDESLLFELVSEYVSFRGLNLNSSTAVLDSCSQLKRKFDEVTDHSSNLRADLDRLCDSLQYLSDKWQQIESYEKCSRLTQLLSCIS
jgi:hypothetical protein